MVQIDKRHVMPRQSLNPSPWNYPRGIVKVTSKRKIQNKCNVQVEAGYPFKLEPNSTSAGSILVFLTLLGFTGYFVRLFFYKGKFKKDNRTK